MSDEAAMSDDVEIETPSDEFTTPTGTVYVRTPEDRFADLPEFGYLPKFSFVAGLRMAHLDEGDPDGEPILLLHGEPTWGFLYRKMIPTLVDAGYRVLVPDLIGFGRSDKPVDREIYTYERHVLWLTRWLEALDVDGLTLFCQDWGGLLGLRLAAENEELFERLVIANTVLPEGEPMSEGFMAWQKRSQEMDWTFPGEMMKFAVESGLSDAEGAAYSAPFPDDRYLAGPRQFPLLVPTGPTDPAVPANKKAWEELEAWTKPVLTLWDPGDRVLGGYQQGFIDRIPGAAGHAHHAYAEGGHFIQEEHGPDLAARMAAFIEATPVDD